MSSIARGTGEGDEDAMQVSMASKGEERVKQGIHAIDHFFEEPPVAL